MHYLSEEEMLLKWEPGRDFTPTDPPVGPVYNVAEFDQQQGVLVRYPFGIPVTLIAEMSEDVMVTTIVANSSQENTVTNLYMANGVNLNHCDFLIAPSESYWTRDYGPWFVIDGNFQFGIVDFVYNRPRPNDDDIPVKMADFMSINLFGMDLTTAGGNYMTDGYGNSTSSELIWEENQGYSHDQIAQLVEDYLGIATYSVLPDPLGEYIKHIDCWAKFLDVDKVLIGQVPQSDPRYQDYEYIAEYFTTHLSGWNKPYEVYRIYTPGGYPNTPYTNSLILNKKVFVPITGSQWDDEALAVYQEAMPGYEIIGITADAGDEWLTTDAIHCRAIGVADQQMVWIKHMPLWGSLPEQAAFPVEADIIPMSGQSLNPDSVLLSYKINGGDYTSLIMTTDDDTTYYCEIPGSEAGDEIAYFIHAVDQSGNSANNPYIGAPDPHVFHIQQTYEPDILVYPTNINDTCMSGTSLPKSFTIYNTGNLNLTFTIDHSTAINEDFSYPVSNSPDGSTWNFNTYTELGWTEITVADEGTIGNWSITFDWTTTGFPNGGSFQVESPLGTQAQISGSLNNGTYTKAVEAFNGESMQGIWKIWVQDLYGDGGHEASNITITITRTSQPPDWLIINTLSGTITPDENQEISLTLDAGLLQNGTYPGEIYINSNDPDEPLVTIPMILVVEPLPDVTVVPDSLTYINYDQMILGQTVMIYNYNDVPVTINDINNQGYNGFPWYIDPWTINLPYELAAGDSLDLSVKVDIPVDNFGYWLEDSLLIQTDASIHKVVLRIDSDLLSSIENHDNEMVLQSYPNPFDNLTTIIFTLLKPARVAMEVHDLSGQIIKTLVNSYLFEGQQNITWDGKNNKGQHIPEGLYILELKTGEKTIFTKIVITR
jgi:agmatine/peptidylarginine deiminase/subtilisin-like proprotein convertase family protein